jgi:pimeloyl-ACP methyl ester carboxylesterase
MTTANPPYELKQVDTSAGRMAYRETGSPDAPVALYVHGVIVNGHLWRHQLEAFTDIRRNLAVDLLGHGHSVAAAADIDAYVTPYVTCPAQLQDLERFILAFDPAQTIRIHDRLEQLTTPTAIVWGTGDIFFDERWSHWLADTIPGTRSRTSLGGARLLFPEERPDELNREILRLWELDR